MLTWDEAEEELLRLGVEYQKNPNAQILKAVQHQAILLQNLDTARSSEVAELLKGILPSDRELPLTPPILEAGPPPADESERIYEKLSREQKDAVLEDLKDWMEQGLMSPSLKPSFLEVDPTRIVCSQNRFDGNPLPEFCSISWNILDCFATALISTPAMQFPARPLVVRCRLGEEAKNLMLYLIAMLTAGDQIFPLELNDKSEMWIASKLRPLAQVKGIALGNIFWDRSGQHSFFFFDYPGQMIRDKVPGLGAPGEDGKPRWPECELLLDPMSATMREKARHAVDFVQSNADGPIQ